MITTAWQCTKDNELYLNIDMVQMGVGGNNSWGYLPTEDDLLPNFWRTRGAMFASHRCSGGIVKLTSLRLDFLVAHFASLCFDSVSLLPVNVPLVFRILVEC
jgi:hypothetical protein